jgi:DNA primase
VHDHLGRFIWFEGRYIGNLKKRKYYRPDGIFKTKVLFNYHKVKNKDCIVVVEGILDAMLLHCYGFGAVCSFGARLSDEQVSMLVKFNEVVIAFDLDDAGIDGYIEAKKKISGVGVEMSRVVFPRNKDVCDITENEFVKLYNKRYAI